MDPSTLEYLTHVFFPVAELRFQELFESVPKYPAISISGVMEQVFAHLKHFLGDVFQYRMSHQLRTEAESQSPMWDCALVFPAMKRPVYILLRLLSKSITQLPERLTLANFVRSQQERSQDGITIGGFLCVGALGLRFLPIFDITTPRLTQLDLMQYPSRSLFWTALETARRLEEQEAGRLSVTDLLRLVFLSGQMSAFDFNFRSSFGTTNDSRPPGSSSKFGALRSLPETSPKRPRTDNSMADGGSRFPTDSAPKYAEAASSDHRLDDPKECKIAQVLLWIESLGLDEETCEETCNAFRMNKINGFLLLRLDATLLKEMGISALGTRMRLLDAIRDLKPAGTGQRLPITSRAFVDLTSDAFAKTEPGDAFVADEAIGPSTLPAVDAIWRMPGVIDWEQPLPGVLPSVEQAQNGVYDEPKGSTAQPGSLHTIPDPSLPVPPHLPSSPTPLVRSDLVAMLQGQLHASFPDEDDPIYASPLVNPEAEVGAFSSENASLDPTTSAPQDPSPPFHPWAPVFNARGQRVTRCSECRRSECKCGGPPYPCERCRSRGCECEPPIQSAVKAPQPTCQPAQQSVMARRHWGRKPGSGLRRCSLCKRNDWGCSGPPYPCDLCRKRGVECIPPIQGPTFDHVDGLPVAQNTGIDTKQQASESSSQPVKSRGNSRPGHRGCQECVRCHIRCSGLPFPCESCKKRGRQAQCIYPSDYARGLQSAFASQIVAGQDIQEAHRDTDQQPEAPPQHPASGVVHSPQTGHVLDSPVITDMFSTYPMLKNPVDWNGGDVAIWLSSMAFSPSIIQVLQGNGMDGRALLAIEPWMLPQAPTSENAETIRLAQAIQGLKGIISSLPPLSVQTAPTPYQQQLNGTPHDTFTPPAGATSEHDSAMDPRLEATPQGFPYSNDVSSLTQFTTSQSPRSLENWNHTPSSIDIQQGASNALGVPVGQAHSHLAPPGLPTYRDWSPVTLGDLDMSLPSEEEMLAFLQGVEIPDGP